MLILFDGSALASYNGGVKGEFTMLKNKLKIAAAALCVCAAAGSVTPVTAVPVNGYRAVFNAEEYYNAYPDLQAAFGKNDSQLFSHFVNYGIKEGRSGSSEFNIGVYRANNPDLVQVFGNDLGAYCQHYATYGKAEGRVATDGTMPTGSAISVQESSPAGTKIADCTTSYQTGVPRAINIQVAASRINGVVVQPGQQFSFSRTILLRTEANGYVLGPAYSAGKVIQSVGGGICQVSSTLYAAMLHGSIPASERHAHSMPVPYLPEGMDATISGTWKDLKFVNQTGRPIQIQASADNGTLTVALYRM